MCLCVCVCVVCVFVCVCMCVCVCVCVCVCRIEQLACQFRSATFAVTYLWMHARVVLPFAFSQFNIAILSFLSYRAANTTVRCCPADRNVQLGQQCGVFLGLILYRYFHKKWGQYFYYNFHCMGVETRMYIW